MTPAHCIAICPVPKRPAAHPVYMVNISRLRVEVTSLLAATELRVAAASLAGAVVEEEEAEAHAQPGQPRLLQSASQRPQRPDHIPRFDSAAELAVS